MSIFSRLKDILSKNNFSEGLLFSLALENEFQLEDITWSQVHWKSSELFLCFRAYTAPFTTQSVEHCVKCFLDQRVIVSPVDAIENGGDWLHEIGGVLKGLVQNTGAGGFISLAEESVEGVQSAIGVAFGNGLYLYRFGEQLLLAKEKRDEASLSFWDVVGYNTGAVGSALALKVTQRIGYYFFCETPSRKFWDITLSVWKKSKCVIGPAHLHLMKSASVSSNYMGDEAFPGDRGIGRKKFGLLNIGAVVQDLFFATANWSHPNISQAFEQFPSDSKSKCKFSKVDWHIRNTVASCNFSIYKTDPSFEKIVPPLTRTRSVFLRSSKISSRPR